MILPMLDRAEFVIQPPAAAYVLRMTRDPGVAALVLSLAVLLVGCGRSEQSKTDLTMIALNTSVGRAEFHVRCRPAGGDLPRTEHVCATLASDPRLVTRPQPFTCAGGSFSWWDVTVSGRLNGRPIRRSFSTCWTPQMTLIGKLGLSWNILKAHLVRRRVKRVAPGQQVTVPPGVLRPTDLVVCTIGGHNLSVGVPEVVAVSSTNGYDGANVQNVELDVDRLPDGSVMASCHYGMTLPQDFIALAMGSSTGKSWGLRELFSRKPETTHCIIHGGGPPPGIRVPGTCSTIVLPGDGVSATVRFSESWNAKNFHGSGAGKREQLSHVFELMVSTRARNGDHVVQAKSYGDLPPQLIP